MLIVANWKAYVDDLAKAKTLMAASSRAARGSAHTIVIAPPAPLLGALARRRASPLAFAIQDISVTTGGAETGEITARAAAAAGATYAIVGHSERRARGETDAVVSEKLVHALAHELVPILCIGERERDADGRYLGFVREQLTRALEGVDARDRARVVIAYEPLWAIGKAAADAIRDTDLAEMVLYIRKVLAELLPGASAKRAHVLYGGAVEVENVRSLAGASGVDGFLIGHASVDPKVFGSLVRELH